MQLCPHLHSLLPKSGTLSSPPPSGAAGGWLCGDFARGGGLGLGTWGPSELESLWRVLLSMGEDWGQGRAELKAHLEPGTKPPSPLGWEWA